MGLSSAGMRDASAVFSLPVATRWESLRRRFSADGYVALPGLISPAGLAELGREARRLEADAVRRDFRMPGMADSPRHMTTLGGHQIARASPVIRRLYEDRDLMRLLSSLLGETVVAVHDPVERHVLNVLHRPGDTHGTHTDDYPLALVLFLEAPPHHTDGGLLEFHPGRGDLGALDAPGSCITSLPTGTSCTATSPLTVSPRSSVQDYGVACSTSPTPHPIAKARPPRPPPSSTTEARPPIGAAVEAIGWPADPLPATQIHVSRPTGLGRFLRIIGSLVDVCR